jgi:hypothetical protein
MLRHLNSDSSLSPLVELPPKLLSCTDKLGMDPTKFLTRGDLLIGYGDERTLRVETQKCVREIMRLIDLQNAGAGLPEPFNVGGNR